MGISLEAEFCFSIRVEDFTLPWPITVPTIHHLQCLERIKVHPLALLKNLSQEILL